jgi:hypothetical protein
VLTKLIFSKKNKIKKFKYEENILISNKYWRLTEMAAKKKAKKKVVKKAKKKVAKKKRK